MNRSKPSGISGWPNSTNLVGSQSVTAEINSSLARSPGLKNKRSVPRSGRRESRLRSELHVVDEAGAADEAGHRQDARAIEPRHRRQRGGVAQLQVVEAVDVQGGTRGLHQRAGVPLPRRGAPAL